MEKFRFLRKQRVIYPEREKMPSARLAREAQPYGAWCTPPLHPEPLNPIKVKETMAQRKTEPILKTTEARLILHRKLRSMVVHSSQVFQPLEDGVAAEPAPKHKKRVIDVDRKCAPVESLTLEEPQSPVPGSPSGRKPAGRLPIACRPDCAIDPQGCTYICWLLVMTLCYSYNAWAVPLRATFPYQTPENTWRWFVADYTCDVFYVLDALLVKPRLMFLHDGFWVDDLQMTRKNYMGKLQYKMDLLALVPLDLLYLVFGTGAVLLRFPRLLKLQTCWEFHVTMDRVLSSPYMVRIGKTLAYIFYLIHLNACAYYAMSAHEGLGSNEWVYNGEGNAYVRCFYFATKTATSIGKNPKPENEPEYLFMTAAWLMGVFVFALLIGQIRDIIATATRAQTEYRKLTDETMRYLRRLALPTELQRRVASWFAFTWKQQRCFDESRILDSLPANMKLDVSLEVHIGTLAKAALLRDCEPPLLRDLVLKLRPAAFLPGDLVCRRGDVGKEMYIIKMGQVLVMSEDEREVLATLKEGGVFGEISLLGIDGATRRTATVRSRGYSTLFVLSKSDLEDALRHYPVAQALLRRRADQLIRENAARAAAEREHAQLSATHSQSERATSPRSP